MNVTLNIGRTSVLDSVAMATSYTGKKMTDDEGAYERMFTTDSDRELLADYWGEAADIATEQLMPFSPVLASGDNYNVTLTVSASWDSNLQGSCQNGLKAYFVAYILSRWYRLTNKNEAEQYGAEADAKLEDVMRKLYYKKKPTRTPIS